LRVYLGRDENGHPIQQSETFPGGSRAADTRLREMISELEASQGTGNETFGDLLDQFLEHAESLGRSPTTLREYRRIADKTLRPALGSVLVRDLSAKDLDRLYRSLTKKGNKATTVRRVHALVSVALHQARKWGMVKVNVAQDATPPAVHSAEISAPDPDEVRRIVAAAEEIEPSLAALLLVAALTGCRRGELCALRWTDLDEDARTLRIERSVYETKGGGVGEKGTKGHQARLVPLDDFALAVFRRHRAAVDELAVKLDLPIAPDAFVFSRSPQGLEPLYPDTVSKFTTRVAKAAGVDAHLHGLRHYTATQAVAGGMDLVTVAAFLGHKDSTTTARFYAHSVEGKRREMAGLLGRALALPR
jgi:integrase